MPYKSEFVFADLFIEHNNVRIFHTYKDNDYDNDPQTYFYATSSDYDSNNDLEETFDVRELSTWTVPERPPFLTGDNDTEENRKAWDKYHEDKIEEKAIIEAIKKAIEIGEIDKFIRIEDEG